MELKTSITILIIGIIITSQSIIARRKGKKNGSRGKNIERRGGFIKRICEKGNFQETSLCKAFKACEEVEAGEGRKLACYNDKCTNDEVTYGDFFCESIKCKINSRNQTEDSPSRTSARECIVELCQSSDMNTTLDVLESKLCRMMMVRKCWKDFNGKSKREERRACIKYAKCVTSDQIDDKAECGGEIGNN